MNINKIYIDTSKSRTDLCNLGAQHGTDKSPYNTGWYRHPYTAVYDFLFAPYRYSNINFGEIGIEGNASMRCWRTYFPNANLYGYDFMPHKLNEAIAQNLENIQYHFMDCRNQQSINDGLSKCVDKFDILIDDASHRPEDQFPVIKAAINHLKPGGIFIIEDIFRDSIEEGPINAMAQSHGVTGVNQYESIIEQYSKYFHHISWVVTNHEARYTPEWENDAWLVMVRNTVEYSE
jgi:SAM-dependent methyltransferase